VPAGVPYLLPEHSETQRARAVGIELGPKLADPDGRHVAVPQEAPHAVPLGGQVGWEVRRVVVRLQTAKRSTASANCMHCQPAFEC
jgi:hypothetical protein